MRLSIAPVASTRIEAPATSDVLAGSVGTVVAAPMVAKETTMPTPPRDAWAIALVAAGSLSLLAACGGEEKKPPATARTVQTEDPSARAAGAHASGEMPEPLVTVTQPPTSTQGAPIVVREEVRAVCNL